jgi:hypothetical protein
MKNKAMLEGKELGEALAAAMQKKGVGPTEVAAVFGVKPPSVSDWKARGCVSKRHLPGLIQYFSDVVGLSHWGLSPQDSAFVNTTSSHVVRDGEPDWPAPHGKIKQALNVLAGALSEIDMAGRERMAPLFESFARSPGAIITNDIAAMLEGPTSIKSQPVGAQTKTFQKIG